MWSECEVVIPTPDSLMLPIPFVYRSFTNSIVTPYAIKKFGEGMVNWQINDETFQREYLLD